MACVTSTLSHVSLILEWLTVSHETKDPAKASCRNVFRSFSVEKLTSVFRRGPFYLHSKGTIEDTTLMNWRSH